LPKPLTEGFVTKGIIVMSQTLCTGKNDDFAFSGHYKPEQPRVARSDPKIGLHDVSYRILLNFNRIAT
jgi:hypothetical protein